MRIHAPLVLAAVAAAAPAPVAGAHDVPLFQGQRTLTVQAEFTLGDFDRDGREDLVIVDWTDPVAKDRHLRLLRGNGFGRFERTDDVYAPPPGTLFTQMRAVDVDGDAQPEIVVHRLTSPNVIDVIAYGDQGFHLLQTLPMPVNEQPVGVVASDLDADGDVDLAYSINGSNGIALFFNQGGSFSAGLVLPTGGESVKALTAGDVDGDGHVDLVAGSTFFSRLRISRGLGGGAFAPSVAVTISAGPGAPPNLSAIALSSSDHDADGVADVRVAWQSHGCATYLGGPALTFPRVNTVLEATKARDAAFVDLDHDGDTDVVLSGDAGVAAAFDDGQGGLIPGNAPLVPFQGKRIELAHLDGDGMWDALVLANNELLTYLADGPGEFALPEYGPVGTAPLSIAHAQGDIDQDGDDDLVRHWLADGSFHLSMNDGQGGFVPGPQLTAASSVYRAELADLDGDGYPELISVPFGTKALHVYANVAGTLQPLQSIPASPGIGPLDRMGIGDLDGDGDLDVVVSAIDVSFGVAIFLNQGGQLTTAPGIQGPTTEFLDLEIHDVTGDGIADVFGIEYGNSFSFLVYPGQGGGTFGAPFVAPLPTRPLHMLLADLTGDGQPEIVVACRDSLTSLGGGSYLAGSIRVFGIGSGTTFPQLGRSNVFTHEPGDLRVADVDGDGNLDVVSEVRDAGVHLGNGAGALEPAQLFEIGLEAKTVHVLDVDGDAELELAIHRWKSEFIEVRDGVCRGRAGRFGHGCAGGNGKVPSLSLSGCIRAGEPATFAIRDAAPNSIALLAIGLAPAPSAQSAGCTLQVLPLLSAALVLPLPATPQGTGAIEIPFVFPASPTLVGVRFAEQAFCADPALPWGYSTTQGLEIVGG